MFCRPSNCSLLFNLHRPVSFKNFFTFNYLFLSGLFSGCSKWELLFSGSAWDAHCCSISCCGAGALGSLGLIPGPRRYHMPRRNPDRGPQLWSLHSRACAPQQEKPPQRRLCATSREWPLLTTTIESPHAAVKTQHNQEINKKFFN